MSFWRTVIGSVTRAGALVVLLMASWAIPSRGQECNQTGWCYAYTNREGNGVYFRPLSYQGRYRRSQKQVGSDMLLEEYDCTAWRYQFLSINGQSPTGRAAGWNDILPGSNGEYMARMICR